MRARRSLHVVPIITLFLWVTLPLPAEPQGGLLLKKVGKWCFEQLVSYGVGKGIDFVIGQNFHQQLEQEIPGLVAQIAAKIGPQRVVLQENLALHQEQLAMLTQLTQLTGPRGPQGPQGAQGSRQVQEAQEKRIVELKADQERLLRRIDNLEARMTKIERRVDEIDSYVSELNSRVSRLEDAMIHECLDLRRADVLGKDEFRIRESPSAWSADHSESDDLTLDMRLLLNSCTGDLTQRGLLIQLSLVTRDLKKDMLLYATFTGVQSGGQISMLSRQEIPLARPSYRVDGQVVELFFPYGDILHLSSPDRIALALVLTHDGDVFYTFPSRVMSCAFGQRVTCRWEL
jgi:uncharacterized coiled-coil protein SlyX